MSDDEISHAEYREIIKKMGAVQKRRTPREIEIEKILEVTVPGLLRELLEATGGSKRAALAELNARLDEAGEERNVSTSTFYDWLEKYHLD